MDLDAFVCDRCKRQIAGRPAAYWSTLSFVVLSTGGARKLTVEFCGACATEIQRTVGASVRLPRADRTGWRGLVARLAAGKD